MRSCWHEVPTKRPTFTELKATLEHLLSQETPYIELAIDPNQEYYLLPIVKSTRDSDENDEKDNDEDDEDDDDDHHHDDHDDDHDHVGDGSGDGPDNDNHSPKITGSLPNSKEPQYKNISEC